MVGSWVVFVVGLAAPAVEVAPASEPADTPTWEQARRRWFRMEWPRLLHPDLGRPAPCAGMGNLLRLGEGRFGSWTLAGYSSSTRTCGRRPWIVGPPLSSVGFGVAWTAHHMPLSLFATAGPSTFVGPTKNTTGMQLIGGLRWRF